MAPLGELASALRYLLPGLVVAWVFYGLTSYEKPSEFERIAQALAFTAMLDLTSRAVLAAGAMVGRLWGPWLPAGDATSVALALAIPFGLLVAWLANTDRLHALLRDFGITNQSGRPDQWDATFRRRSGYAILDLADGRRICGWPQEWPDRQGVGHFLLRDHRWIDAGGAAVPNTDPGAILIPAGEVGIVQFLEEMD